MNAVCSVACRFVAGCWLAESRRTLARAYREQFVRVEFPAAEHAFGGFGKKSLRRKTPPLLRVQKSSSRLYSIGQRTDDEVKAEELIL